MNDCCRNHDSKFCPECGKRITFEDEVGGRLLVMLRSRVTAARKACDRHQQVDSHARRDMDALARLKGFAKWVSDRLEQERDALRAAARQDIPASDGRSKAALPAGDGRQGFEGETFS